MRTRQLRSIILAVLSLAVVGALFTIYQFTQTQTTPFDGDLPTAQATPTPPPVTMSSTGENTMQVGDENVAVSGGGGVRYKIYDDDGSVRGEITMASWKPLGERGTQAEVVAPNIRMHTPGGQIIAVTSQRGVIERKSSDLSRMDMRSAKLAGNVKIKVDRLSDAQREAVTADPTLVNEADRYIHLTLDDIFFDLEFARIETEGSFHVIAAEAEIAGEGLSLRYNELESRVEELTIRQGRRIVVKNLSERFKLRGLGATDGQTPDQPAPSPTPQPSPTPESDVLAKSSDGADTDDVPPLLAEDEPRRPRKRPTDVYTAIFEGDIDVSEFEDDAVSGKLLADRLHILFDFSQQERELARQAPGATRSGAAGASSNGVRPATVPPAGAEDRIELTWTGPLHITSQRLAEAPTEGDQPQRVHLTATGQHVMVKDALRQVDCRKLVFRNEEEAVELSGTAERPAHVLLADGGELFGREIVLERKAGRAHARGPQGRLVAAIENSGGMITGMSAGSSAARGAPLEVRFDREVIALFGVAPIERFDPRTGESVTVQREMLESAVFSGEVRMIRGNDRFAGERIELDFGLDPNGKQHPVAVRAYENVVAAQGGRYIQARDRLLVDFELISKRANTQPFNLAVARQMARDRGEDPATINWTAVEQHYNRQRDYQSGLRILRAFGEAEVRDPMQKLEIDCDVLECRFRHGREITSGLVTPRGGGTAYIALGSFSISASTPIPFDALAQTARVDGPGRMTFPSEQDIDGRALDEPMIVGVKWQERMSFDGKKNEAMFRGGVTAETERSDFRCANLRIDFEDRATIEPPPIAANTNTPEKWWVLQPLIEKATGDSDGNGLNISGPAIEKEPIYLYATQDVVAQTTNHDERSGKLRSRVRFAGPVLAIDLKQRHLLMDGAGTLLIEDYRKAFAQRTNGAPAARETSPFGRAFSDDASQTFIAWQESMSYHDTSSAAQFRKNVTLVHSTGAKMKRAAEIIGPAAAASGRGRESKLNCQELVVSFIRESDRRGRNSGTGQMSGTEVDAFTASERVYFVDSGISAIANQITYSRADGALQILGTRDAPAELFDQRNRFNSLKGPKFIWNRQTNQILAPNARGRMN
jgi:hypothetical protein